MSRCLEINEPTVVHDTIDGEVLVIRNDTGVYYAFEGTGADIWAALAAGLSEEGIVEVVRSRCAGEEDEVRSAVSAFLEKLLVEQLVRIGSTPLAVVGAVPPPLTERPRFEPPHLQSYTDMQDLLLFDPIHEVTPAGWPNVADGDT